MRELQQKVRQFMIAAEQDCPATPAIPNDKVRILRVRLLLEEVLEFASASGVDILVHSEDNTPQEIHLENLSFHPRESVDLIEVADAIADINYISYGAASTYGLDMEPFENEVHENNMSKFTTGYKDKDGKWRKGPDYKPVNLAPILEKQIGG